jgi:hypothetical protein
LSARASSLSGHGAYVMALFKQDCDGRRRGRADAVDGFNNQNLRIHKCCVPLECLRLLICDDDKKHILIGVCNGG